MTNKCDCSTCSCDENNDGNPYLPTYKTGDLFVDQIGEWKAYPERFNDNRADLFLRFKIDWDDGGVSYDPREEPPDTKVRRYADGYAYTCANCTGHPVAAAVLQWFECKKAFVPERVWCLVCGNRWAFKLYPKPNQDQGSEVVN